MDLKTVIMLFVLPGITYAENFARNKDANFEGTDDKIATFLKYVRISLTAILANESLPEVPKELK